MADTPRRCANFKTNEEQIVDPTTNVLKLVEQAVKRIDDLRISDNKYDIQIHNLESKRLDDLRLAESRRIDEQMILRENHAQQLREAEAKRIDAIRAVDVNAVAVASERASAQASVLANQVAQSADALRILVASTASTMANAQDQASKQFNDRVVLLEKAQYENKGKSGVEDPMVAKLFTKMDSLIESRALDSGKGKGRSDMVGWIIGGVMFIIAIASFIISNLKL